MRYRYLDDFRRGISVFAIFSYGIAVLGTPQCPPLCLSIVRNYIFDQNFYSLLRSAFSFPVISPLEHKPLRL